MTGFTFKLELADGSPADPPSFRAAVPTWRPGDTIHPAHGTLGVVRIRDDDIEPAAVLVVKDTPRTSAHARCAAGTRPGAARREWLRAGPLDANCRNDRVNVVRRRLDRRTPPETMARLAGSPAGGWTPLLSMLPSRTLGADRGFRRSIILTPSQCPASSSSFQQAIGTAVRSNRKKPLSSRSGASSIGTRSTSEIGSRSMAMPGSPEAPLSL
jgi:hypothetical protein